VWFLWIRGATSQVQIVYLLLSLFCNEPTWLAYNHKKNLKAWRLLKIECSIWKYYSSPVNWHIYIGKRWTTFAKSYQIKLRCYWEHIREHIGNKGNLQSHSDPKSERETLGCWVHVVPSHWLHVIFIFKIVDHLFSPRLNAQGTNIHNWCWWTIFLLSAWISKHSYLQKDNYGQLWYLAKPSLVVFDAEIENPTQDYQFEIRNYFKPHHQLILDFNSFII
jgi:hypothetical protein